MKSVKEKCHYCDKEITSGGPMAVHIKCIHPGKPIPEKPNSNPNTDMSEENHSQEPPAADKATDVEQQSKFESFIDNHFGWFICGVFVVVLLIAIIPSIVIYQKLSDRPSSDQYSELQAEVARLKEENESLAAKPEPVEEIAEEEVAKEEKPEPAQSSDAKPQVAEIEPDPESVFNKEMTYDVFGRVSNEFLSPKWKSMERKDRSLIVEWKAAEQRLTKDGERFMALVYFPFVISEDEVDEWLAGEIEPVSYVGANPALNDLKVHESVKGLDGEWIFYEVTRKDPETGHLIPKDGLVRFGTDESTTTHKWVKIQRI